MPNSTTTKQPIVGKEDRSQIYMRQENKMVPLPDEISITKVSLTLPLALTALAVLIPTIVAWSINYYRVGENAAQIAAIEKEQKTLRQGQHLADTQLQLQTLMVNQVKDTVNDIKLEQRDIAHKIDNLADRP